MTDTDKNCPHCGVHIDEHPASRCLDAWVAEVVFEQELCPVHHSYNCCGRTHGASSTSIAAAWEVVEKLNNWNVDDNMFNLRGQGPEGFEEGVGWWDADIGGARGHFSAKADTAPHAICRAAIKALSGRSIP